MKCFGLELEPGEGAPPRLSEKRFVFAFLLLVKVGPATASSFGVSALAAAVAVASSGNKSVASVADSPTSTTLGSFSAVAAPVSAF